MTGAVVLARATRALTAAGVPDAGRDARRLLAHVLKVPPGRLTLFLQDPIDPDLEVIFNVLIERRCERVPVSHLTGRRLFYGREYLVSPDVLDPRPETEILIEAALAEPFDRVLDLGTGSGCILLTLLAETENTTGVGVDLSAQAMGVAFWNRNSLRLEDRAVLETGDWYGALPADAGQFDLIVSNPPYIAQSEMLDLSPEVRDHEPIMALTDGLDGLSAYQQIIAQAMGYLSDQGRLMVEIGPTQAKPVSDMMRLAGFNQISVIPDLDGRDRVVAGRAQATTPTG